MSAQTLRKTSLRGLLVLFTLLAIGAAVSGWTHYRNESVHTQAIRYGKPRTIADLRVTQIANWRQQRMEDAGLTASQSGLRASALAWLRHPTDEVLRWNLRGQMSLFRNIRDYQNVLLTKSGGSLLFVDLSTRDRKTELVRSTVQAGRSMLGDLFRCRKCGQIHVNAATPILDDQGLAQAVILLRSDPERRLYPLLQSWPTFGQIEEVLLSRWERPDVLFPNYFRHAGDPTLTLWRSVNTLDLPATQAIWGWTNRFINWDYRAEVIITDLRSILNSPWFMVAKVDEREIPAELHYRNRVVLAITVLGITILGILLWLLFYLSQTKIYRGFFQATHIYQDRQSIQNQRWVARYLRVAGASGTITLLIGAFALLGWILDAPTLKGVLPGFVAMKTNTALGLMLAGTAIVLRAWFPRYRRTPIALATLLALLGAATLAQYLFHLDFHIDQALFGEPADALGTLAPNRMAPATAAAFLLSGCALALSPFRRGAVLSQWLALPAGLIGMLPLLGYLYGPIGASGLGHYLQLALHTALAMILVCLGLLMLNPMEGFARVLTTQSLGGWLLRRLLPIILMVSLLIGWLRAVGEQWGWFEHAMAMALMVTAFMLLFLSAIWWVARSLDHMDTIRSQAEARAHEAAEEIRATLYGIGDGVIAADHAGVVVHMNPVAEQLTGWKESEAVGRSLNKVFHIVNEDTRETVESPVEQVLRDGRIVGLASNTLLIARDGTERAIADSGAPIRNTAQDIALVVLVFRDQTEERRLSRLTKLRMDLQIFAGQHSLDELLTHTLDEAGRLVESPIGFYHFHDEDTGNLTLQQWSTRTLEEFCKAKGNGTHYPLDQAGMWADCIRQRKPVIHNDYMSLPHRKGLPDGHAPIVRELVVPVIQGNRVVAILGVGNKPTNYTDRDVETIRFLADATWSLIDHKRYEMALRTSEAKHRQLYENLRDAYARVDRDGYIIDHNPVFEEMVGYSGEELRRMTYRDLTPPEWHAEEDRILREQVVVRGFSDIYEKAYQRKDGTVFPVELRTIAFQDEQGRPAGMWALARDITERKRNEDRQREAERTARGTLDGLSEHIAILDEQGVILDVNQAWRRFAEENPPIHGSVSEGANYFEVCASASGPDGPSAAAFADGIRSVMAGRQKEYAQEYDCHSPEVQRWFLGRVTRFAGDGPLRVVVAHENITERKRAEIAMLRALTEAARFRKAMDQLSVYVYIKDRQGRYVYANRPTLELFGCTTEELAGSSDDCYFPAETAIRLREVDSRVLERGEDTAEEVLSRAPDGSQRVYWEVKTPVFDETGQVWGLCGISTDITDRKASEEALRTSEEKFRLLVESNPDAIFVQTNGQFAYLNEAAVQLFGSASSADLLNHPVLDRIPPDRRAEVLERIRDMNVERKQHPRHEEQFLRMDGTTFFGEMSAVPIHFEGKDGALVFLQDITNRIAAEAQIRTQTELLNLTGMMAKVGGWEFDARTFQGSWTDEVARIHDLDPSERIDATQGMAFYSEASRLIIAKAVQEAIERGRPYDLELELVSAKGVRKAVRTIGHPVWDAEGRIAQVRGIFQDISEKKAAEDEIRQAQAETQHLLEIADRSRGALLSLVEDLRMSEEEIRTLNVDLERRVENRTQELAEANRELEAFAYSVSHDLRAPLRHMDGFLSMLERHLGDTIDEKGARYLQVAQRAAVRMAQLVDGLLSFSRLGRTELRRMPVETSHLVASVVDEFIPECADRVVHWDIGPLPEVHGDPTLLRLVFQNLLGNALKFTRTRPEALIEVRTLVTCEGETTLSIRDNGVGFDPTYTHKLFGVFQRLHREDEFEGTGIGLANVHRIIARHGGRVWAEGRLDEGATFFITLPIARRE